MSANKSIERRLITRIFIILSILFISFSAIIYYRSNAASQEINEKQLETTAAALSRSIATDPSGKPRLALSPELAASIRNDPYDSIFIVKSADGKSIWTSDKRLETLAADWRIDENDGDFVSLKDVLAPGDGYYGISRIHDTRAGPFIVFVASPGDKQDFSRFILSEFMGDFLWIVPVLFAVVIGTIMITVRTSLRSISHTSQVAAGIQPDATDIRLQVDNVPSEILPLVNAVNRAFERLDAGFQAERRFTANAAHELRTPLAILKARIGDLENQVASPSVAELKGDIDRMARVVSQLLAIARVETHHPRTEQTCRIDEAVRDAVAGLAPLAIARAQDISAALPDAPVFAAMPYHQIYEAIRNLIENAIEHCGPGTRIAVTVDESGRVAVADSGPGIPDADKELIFERFFRKSRPGASSGGAGLGLSIVSEILRQHHGAIRVTDTPGGGATLEMRLPVASAPSP